MTLSLEEKIIENAKQKALQIAGEIGHELVVDRLCIGVGYTGIVLSDGHGGVSFTFREELGNSCGVMRSAGHIKGTPVSELMELAASCDMAEAAVGTAAVNAVLNRGFSRGPNISEAMSADSTDTIGMVGWFCPLVRRYQTAGTLYVFEKNPEEYESNQVTKMKSGDEACDILPGCNKIVLTGTSFINKTMESLLKASSGAEEIAIVGASTPMCPEVFREYGVTVLAGSQICDADRMMNIVAEGGGGMDIAASSDKLFERI